MFFKKKFLSTCGYSLCIIRDISTSQISLGGRDKWKKLIDCNWLKIEKYKKKILKEKPTCSSDPCQTVPVLPDTTPPEQEPCESESPAVVKKACEPCEPCPPAESDHPVLKPQCDIPLPLVLCIKYFEEPCPQKPVVFPPEQPCPYGIAIDIPIGKFLEEKGFCPELIHPINMNEAVYPDEAALLKRKLKIRLPGQEMKLEKIINSPENYRTERIAYIYKFPKNVMQSGTYNTRFWHLKYNVQQSWENPTMGWISTGDSHAALVLDFGNSDQAIAFCKKNNIKWQLLSPPSEEKKTKKQKQKPYEAIFSWNKRTRASTK